MDSFHLTKSELEVLHYRVLGMSCEQIAEKTFRSIRTVHIHLYNSRTKIRDINPGAKNPESVIAFVILDLLRYRKTEIGYLMDTESFDKLLKFLSMDEFENR